MNFFSTFYDNMQKAIYSFNTTADNNHQENVRSKVFHYSSIPKRGHVKIKPKNKRLKLNRIEQLDRMDRHIDRQRFDDGLIGKIKQVNKTSSLSKKMEDDLACLKIRNFHKLNALSRGQFATSKNKIYKKEIFISALPDSNC